MLFRLLPCAIALLIVARARAESAVLLPHAGADSLLEQRELAQQAVAAALREAGFEVQARSPAASNAAASKGAEPPCTQVACAPALIKQLGARIAVALAVWQAERKVEIHVTIVDAAGSHFPGRAAAALDGDASNAARSALVDAQSLQLLGAGPWVAVNGEPKGAAVWIDGRFVGSLPYRAGVSPGDHTLEVRAEGRAAKQLALRVPLEPTATARVDVALDTPDTAAASSGTKPGDVALTNGAATTAAVAPINSEPRARPSPWNYVLGGALTAVGGALIVVNPVRAAARDGRCADPECNRVYDFGTRSAVELAAGIALVGAGITVLIWQPLRVRAEVGTDHAFFHARFAF
jgi:uncharacterized low-complexity protein